jgi:hypothetical protein
MRNLRFFLGAAVLLMGITGCELAQKIGRKAESLTETPALANDYPMPFAVKVGGQATSKKNSLCSQIANPVANNAELAVDVKPNKMIIVNIYPSDANAKIPQGAKCLILLIKKGETKTTLDKTTSKEKLKPGIYLMNITAAGNTARVMFTVK